MALGEILGSIWIPAFTCPKCGRKAAIYEAHLCMLSNTILDFVIEGCEEDENGNLVGVDEVSCEWGRTYVDDDSYEDENYFCGECDSPIDDVHTREELFNWLYQRGMVECQTVGNNSK